MKTNTFQARKSANVIKWSQRRAAVFFRWYLRMTGGYNLRVSTDLRAGVPYVFIANHQSRIDPFIVFSALPQYDVKQSTPLRFMTARSIYYSPLLPILKVLGCYPTRQAGVDVIKRSVSYLESGYNVFIFPEGRRVLRTESDPRSGVERILATSPADVRPVLVHIEWSLLKWGRRHVEVGFREVDPQELHGLTAKDIMLKVYEV